MDACFEYYTRAFINYRATVRDHYYRTNQVCVKLAQYHAIKNQPEAAKYFSKRISSQSVPLTKIDSIFFDQALSNFGLHAFTKPELALTKHKKAKLHARYW